MEVIPTLGKGTLGAWPFHRSNRPPDTEPAIGLRLAMELGPGQTNRSWAYANQRFNLASLWEGSRKKHGQDSEPDLGKPAVRDYWGASGNVAMVEM